MNNINDNLELNSDILQEEQQPLEVQPPEENLGIENNQSNEQELENLVENNISDVKSEVLEESNLENKVEVLTEDSSLMAIAELQAKIDDLEQQLINKTEENEINKSQYLRIVADFENFRRRTTKEKEELEQQIKKKTIIELLPVVDNFERARTQIKPNGEGEMTIHKSYQGVYKNLVESLKKIGVSAMRPEGQPFDPNYHEAMLREPTNEHPEGIVLDQLVRGYLLKEEVLRHAMVKVSAPIEENLSSENSPEELSVNEKN